MGLENQVVHHKTIRQIRTRSKGARIYARKIRYSINYDWQNPRRTPVVPAQTALQSVCTDSLLAKWHTEFWFVMLYRYCWCNTDNYLLQLKSHYFYDKIESAAPLKESSISSEAVKWDDLGFISAHEIYYQANLSLVPTCIVLRIVRIPISLYWDPYDYCDSYRFTLIGRIAGCWCW